ncbi:MAG TPA: hypothetical protein VFJ82_05165 [Longimicrobium sp.]|nr:hypothetical protein [Longimicrobium sp.]
MSNGPKPNPPEVRTVLQYLVRTNRQLLLFCGSALMAGSATNHCVLSFAAIAVAGVPPLLLVVLSVARPDALRALGGDTGSSDDPTHRREDEEREEEGDRWPTLPSIGNQPEDTHPSASAERVRSLDPPPIRTE